MSKRKLSTPEISEEKKGRIRSTKSSVMTKPRMEEEAEMVDEIVDETRDEMIDNISTHIAEQLHEKKIGLMFIGRTNPPTRGHIDIILQILAVRDAVFRKTEISIPIILNLSPSSPERLKTASFEDPLTCSIKKNFIETMLETYLGQIGVNIPIGPESNIFIFCDETLPKRIPFQRHQTRMYTSINHLDEIYLFVGADRSIAKSDAYRFVADCNVIPVITPRNQSKISGTIIRNMIYKKSGKTIISPLFTDVVSLLREAYTYNDIQLLTDEQLEILYQSVRDGMIRGLENKTKKGGRGKRRRRKTKRLPRYFF
jgi:hypothetical protein